MKKEKEEIQVKTIKQLVLEDFEENRKLAEGLGKNYFPSGLLKYYSFKNQRYPTYPARIIISHCKMEGILIRKARELKEDSRWWEGERIRSNSSIFIWE